MQYAGNLSGSSPVIKKYKSSAAIIRGTVVLRSAANASGQFSTSTTTSFADALGLLIDNGNELGSSVSYSTTQGDTEAVWSVIVNPDQLLRMLMVTGATGTSITSDTIATATTDGLSVLTTGDPNSPDMDEGLIWYLSGANAGKSRKITATAANDATVVVPFPYGDAVGDVVCYMGQNIGLTGVTLTTDLTSGRTDIADSTGASATCIEVELNGTTDTYCTYVLGDQVWTNAT